MRFRALAGLTLLTGFLACQSDKDVEPAADCLVKASALSGQPIANAYIVTYKPSEPVTATSPNARMAATSAIQRLLDKHELADAQPELLVSGEKTSFLAHISAPEAAELKTDPAVELVEPDRVVSLCSCVDVATVSTLSWNVSATGFGRGDRQTDKTAWVLDTGIDFDHPDLNVDEERSQNFIGGTTADDDNGHGTHVAGIIGALNNTIGVTGVASGVSLVALKILDSEGDGKLSTIVQAVGYVSRVGKAGDVINISIGGEGISTTLERTIRAAADKGILFAIAAGNEGKNASDYAPANINHPNVFTVSAMDRNLNFAEFSNFGPDIDVCAYGVRIQSTYKDGRYATLSGTSMAAPHVAGLLLIRGANIPKRGFVTNDPDGTPDPIARE
ncbi:S8 family serine peptidase [Tellurirhabdus rosea]|uniref:S8 family serine peptidase n=1 Tax=Tellurirhabdus rosea TaxID=2674997 RepID=UPI0022581E46|nr:S8 family serine peptidase [Tellurirhabdus rosea]